MSEPVELVLEDGQWSRFIEERFDDRERPYRDGEDYFDLSDEDEKELFEKLCTERMKNARNPKSDPDFYDQPKKKSPNKKTSKPSENKKKKTSPRKTRDMEDEEPSNSREIEFVQKKTAKLTERLKGLEANSVNIEFHLNRRKQDRASESLLTFINTPRENLFNDPDVRVDRDRLIIRVPDYARERGYESAHVSRPLYAIEMQQIMDKVSDIPNVNPYIERVAREFVNESSIRDIAEDDVL